MKPYEVRPTSAIQPILYEEFERAALDEAIACEKKDAAAQALRQIYALIAEFGCTAQ
jgi:hypothetical protein